MRRVAVVALALAVAGGVGWGLLATDLLRFDASTDVLVAGDGNTRRNLETLKEVMADRHLVGVAVRHPAFFSDDGAAALAGLSDALEALPAVADVKSLTHSGRPVRRGFALDPQEMFGSEVFLPRGPLGGEAWQARAELALAHPLARELFVSADGRWALVLAFVEASLPDHESKRALRQQVEDAVASWRARFDEVHLLAFPFLEVEMREAVAANLRLVVLAAAVLVGGVLLVTFRSLVLVAVLAAFEALGLAALALLLHANGATLNVSTGTLFPLVAGLQLTFLVHLGWALREQLAAGAGWREALGEALDVVLRPSLAAALTTMAGLASLLLCDVGLVATFGGIGAQAVAAVFALTFGPLLLLGRRPRAAGGGEVSVPSVVLPESGAPAPERLAFAERLVAALLARRRLLLCGAVLLLAALLPGLLLVRTGVEALRFLHPDSPGRQGMAVLDEHLGGVNVLQVELDTGRAGGLDDPAVLAYLERLRANVAVLPGVSGVYTYSLLLALLNEAWHGGAPGTAIVPDDPFVLRLLGTALRLSRFPLLGALSDAQGRSSTLVLRTRDMPATRYLEVVGQVLALADEGRPEGLTVSAQEGVHTLLASDRAVLTGQLESLAGGLAAVLLALVVLLRSVRAALLALLVNVPALVAVGGLLGYAALPLNSVTVMACSVVLGVAVDDAIHWLAMLQRERRRGLPLRQAVEVTVAHKLRPMAATSAVLVATLGLCALAPFPPVADFGLLCAAALAVAFASVALLLPVLALGGDGTPPRAPRPAHRRPVPAGAPR